MSQEFKPFTMNQDGRRKIMPSEYEAIRAYYKSVKSQRETAKYYGVSRRLIVFILYFERLSKLYADRKEKKSMVKIL